MYTLEEERREGGRMYRIPPHTTTNTTATRLIGELDRVSVAPDQKKTRRQKKKTTQVTEKQRKGKAKAQSFLSIRERGRATVYPYGLVFWPFWLHTHLHLHTLLLSLALSLSLSFWFLGFLVFLK